jgi:hypothetical protein
VRQWRTPPARPKRRFFFLFYFSFFSSSSGGVARGDREDGEFILSQGAIEKMVSLRDPERRIPFRRPLKR